MKRLKRKQKHNCQECTRLGNCRPAVWRTDSTFKEKMCDEHKHLIRDEIDNGHYTEADYQTWMRV